MSAIIKVYPGSYSKDNLLRISLTYKETPLEDKYFLLNPTEATILAHLLLEEVRRG